MVPSTSQGSPDVRVANTPSVVPSETGIKEKWDRIRTFSKLTGPFQRVTPASPRLVVGSYRHGIPAEDSARLSLGSNAGSLGGRTITVRPSRAASAIPAPATLMRISASRTGAGLTRPASTSTGIASERKKGAVPEVASVGTGRTLKAKNLRSSPRRSSGSVSTYPST